MKQKNSIRIEPIHQGIHITLPAYHPVSIGNIFSSFFLLLLGTIPLILFLFIVFKEGIQGIPISSFIIITIPFFTSLFILIFLHQNKRTAHKYKLVIFSHEFTIVNGFASGEEKNYNLTFIRNLHLNVTDNFMKMRPALADILFDYESRTVKCCEGITYSDGETLLKSLNELIRFRCHSVSCIVFGQPQFALPDETHFLLDPDVSELMMPFYHLDTLVILTESYNFMLIEQFLTYAINQIGRTYLKRVVEAHIYGNREKLHPNIRNNLINICKKIYFHDEKASYSVFEKMACD